jgi:thiol-disulfide isomerase/thioredoxin
MTMFPELTESELIRLRWSQASNFAVYMYSPWCGTCRYGEKMLSVVKTMAPSAAIYKSNVNFLPNLVPDWRIESVPCLIFIEQKRMTEKLYTMRSVEYLLEKVRRRLLPE